MKIRWIIISLSITLWCSAQPRNLVVEAAQWQVGKTMLYDGAYVSLSYPNGDLPIKKGVCTDVVIRALRKARHDGRSSIV